MKQNQDTYKEVEIFQYDNFVARVYSPILTPEERAKRMKEIERAALQLILAAQKSNK